MRLLEMFPHYGVAFDSYATLQWPTADLAAIATQHVNAADIGPVAVWVVVAKEISIEFAVIEPPRDETPIGSRHVEVLFALKAGNQLRKELAVNNRLNNKQIRWIRRARINREEDGISHISACWRALLRPSEIWSGVMFMGFD